ncbi:GNAT family N-acetyltransferase [Alloiococcus sp. CFN-8]|uniref:GNAT family N-acetyltransferase n=1 Tax=Alloiococcus sp. CFN-8 TaxID=3416081 RepID=UPI003CEC45C3
MESAKALGIIHSASWKSAYKGIIPDEILNGITPEKREKYFEKALSLDWEKDAIINVNGKEAGFISIGECRDDDKNSTYGEIRGLYLLPEYWGQGFGKALFTWGIKELEKQNYTSISIWVLEDNIRARRFYEKQGFIFDGTVKEIIIGKKLNEVRYVSK